MDRASQRNPDRRLPTCNTVLEIDEALYAVVMEANVHGVSTRGIDDLVKARRGPPRRSGYGEEVP